MLHLYFIQNFIKILPETLFQHTNGTLNCAAGAAVGCIVWLLLRCCRLEKRCHYICTLGISVCVVQRLDVKEYSFQYYAMGHCICAKIYINHISSFLYNIHIITLQIWWPTWVYGDKDSRNWGYMAYLRIKAFSKLWVFLCIGKKKSSIIEHTISWFQYFMA